MTQQFDFNNTHIAYPDHLCIHQLFEGQAEQTPDATAVVCGDQQLTYRELNQRSNQLAAQLQTLGIQPETLVGICVERSIEMVIGLFAILKAGGAYVPLDPTYPSERLAEILSDAQPTVLLTQDRLLPKFFADGMTILCLDRLLELTLEESYDKPTSSVASDNLAYVIYTSGSTGKPKGVLIEHRGAVNTLLDINRRFHVGPDDRVLTVCSLTFDLSVYDIFGLLAAGGTLVIPPPAIAPDLQHWVELMEREQVTIWNSAPPVMQLFAGYLAKGSRSLPPSLRLVLLSGDWIPVSLPDLIRQLKAGTDPVAIISLGGATEASIWSIFYPIDAVDLNWKSIPYGRPLANQQFYILDETCQPVDWGEIGELHIGGDGVARGYLNRPDLNTARFLPNPFTHQSGARLYRTGDLGRLMPDGNIEFLGRVDHQVKIRGFRVELGEIESVLRQHEAVKEAVVMLHQDRTGEQHLVAYALRNLQYQDLAQPDDQIQNEQIEQWQLVYNEEILSQASTLEDPTFNIGGWNSSYSGEPLLPEEMHEWVDHTVARILALNPDRVLELGCGNGLLLFQVAPHCSHYCGTDFSTRVLQYIQTVLAQPERALPQVTLAQRQAADFSEVTPGSFDTVILNSVLMYFPTTEYLLQVLSHAIHAVGDRGSIFVGDVRHLGLLEAFHGAIVLYQADAQASRNELYQDLQKRLLKEDELLLQPEFFFNLKQYLPAISKVEIQLKRGQFQNEMTQFRYDVILHVGNGQIPASTVTQLSWQADHLTIDSISHLIQQSNLQTLKIIEVPNQRVLGAVQAATLISSPTGPATAAEIRAAIDDVATIGIDPEVFWQLEQTLPYTVKICWSQSRNDCFDVLFEHIPGTTWDGSASPVQEAAVQSCLMQSESLSATAFRQYASDPLKAQFLRKLESQLRAYLEQKLPNYMVPAATVILDAFPVTANGKLDRQALPTPDLLRTGFASAAYVPPTDPLQVTLANIWAEVLGLERVGIHDDFFALGGHSLLAAQVVYRLQDTLEVEIPLSRVFELPTVAALSEHLAPLCQTTHPPHPKLPAITAISREESLPLSFSQSRLWFLSQLSDRAVAYNIPLALKLAGRLDVQALEQSLTEIVRRHETLRTTFAQVNGSPVQTIHAPAPFRLIQVNVEDLSHDPDPKAVTQWLNHEAATPFDLTIDLPLRGKLLCLAQDSHVLMLTMHHIASDGWSLAVFRRELSRLYTAFSQGVASPLKELSIQYADFANWQQQWLNENTLQQPIDYWRQQLASAPLVLDLPTDWPRPGLQTYQGSTCNFALNADLTSKLKQLSQQVGATLFMILLAAFATLLERYSGQKDMIIGSPIANRNRAEIEPLIGFFINLLPLRINLEGEPEFLELVQRVRQVSLDAYANQDVPFEQIVEAVQPERDLSYSPLFQVLFALQNTPPEELCLPGLELTPLKVDNGTSKFDLTLMLEEKAGELVGEIEFSTSLFEVATIQRLVGHLQTLLEGIVTNPNQTISSLPLLSPAEQHQLLVDWNQTQTDYPRNTCIHQIFEQQVEQSPERVALVYADRSLTYAELNQQANQLAHDLQDQGVQPGTRIGVCLDRSLEMIITLLGILKAGGVYLPLDPSYPQERLTMMVSDAEVPLLITQSHLAERFSPQRVQTLCLDHSSLHLQDQSNLNLACNSSQPAYVLYTSGSTGKPKGVEVSHRSVVRLVRSAQPRSTGQSTAYASFRAEDIFLQLAPLAFDASTFEIWGSLLNGAKLVILPPDLPALSELGQAIQSYQISTLWLTAGLFNLMVDEQLEVFHSVRQLLAGGDVLSVRHVKKFMQRYPDCHLINGYGPTENTTFTCCHRITPTDLRKPSIPIGRPISNTQVYVLDQNLHPVPVGVRGELYAGGDGVALGYLNQPDLTTENFIPNPFGLPGETLYKTGDWARYRPDGTLEFLGRGDNQVKLRGFRIELGEVEAAINQYPGIRNSAVVVYQDSTGDKRLAGYVVAEAEGKIKGAELSTFLKHTLPDYMVPAHLVMVDRLPLNLNGKVDRKALPALDREPFKQQDLTAPVTEIEEKLTQIWKQVLDLQTLGTTDNFFDLGGHSLMALRLSHQIEQVFQKKLSVITLFQAPTIVQQAALLQADEVTQRTDIIPIQPLGSKPPLFAIHVLGKGLSYFRPMTRYLGEDQPVYGLAAQVIEGSNGLPNDIKAIASYYIQSLRLVQPKGPYHLVGFSFGGIVVFEMAQQLHAQGEEVALLGLLDTNAPQLMLKQLVARFQLSEYLAHLPKLKSKSISTKLQAWLLMKGLNFPGFESLCRRYYKAMNIPFPDALQDLIFLKQNEWAMMAYDVQSYPGRIVMFLAKEQELSITLKEDPRLSWADIAKGGFDLHEIPGNHMGMVEEPHVQVLAEKIKLYLD